VSFRNASCSTHHTHRLLHLNSHRGSHHWGGHHRLLHHRLLHLNSHRGSHHWGTHHGNTLSFGHEFRMEHDLTGRHATEEKLKRALTSINEIADFHFTVTNRLIIHQALVIKDFNTDHHQWVTNAVLESSKGTPLNSVATVFLRVGNPLKVTDEEADFGAHSHEGRTSVMLQVSHLQLELEQANTRSLNNNLRSGLHHHGLDMSLHNGSSDLGNSGSATFNVKRIGDVHVELAERNIDAHGGS